MIFQQLLFSRHLDEDEKILYVGHKHWTEVLSSLFKISFFGVGFPWCFYLVLGAPPLLWFAIAATILSYIRIFYILVDWYFDAILVTTESLLFVEWHGLFHQESTRIAYHSVESITWETEGFWSVMLGYGTLSIERDAADSIRMERISNPKRLELEIMRGKEDHEDRNIGANTDALKDILSHLVADHIKRHGWKKK